MNTISAGEIKRLGSPALDKLLKDDPVHVTKNNTPTYVVMREADYARLIGQGGLWELLEQPARGTQSKKDIDAQVRSERGAGPASPEQIGESQAKEKIAD